MTRRCRLTVAYVGTGFHGFAESDGVDTVMSRLREAIERVVRVPVQPVGAGRTDAGVHGWGQVISVDLPEGTDLADLSRRVNKLCAPQVAVRDARWVADGFSARFSATWRHYRYHVLNSPEPVPFLAATTWHVREPLNLATMQLACDPVIGEHDFSSFCRRPKVAAGEPEAPMTRRVLLASWHRVEHELTDHLLRFDVRANAFCHQMVRSLVGTMVDVGLGRLHAGQVRGILLARDRNRAGRVAPPEGLCLWEVGYS